MTYCNQDIPNKNRRKREQPSVSLWALDQERRAEEIERYREKPDEPMPVMINIKELGGKVIWPKKFR